MCLIAQNAFKKYLAKFLFIIISFLPDKYAYTTVEKKY